MIKKIAMLFPGQGPQYPGMGKVFYEQSAMVRQLYKQASELLHYDLAEHSFHSTFDKVSDTRYAQPAILAAGYAAYTSYMEHTGSSCMPAFMAGHSMGEITALLCGGAISFDQAVLLAEKRGVLMAEVSAKRGGTMAAIKDFHWRETERICRQVTTATAPVTIAAYNTVMQTVITGDETAVTTVGEKCMERDGIFVPLNITVASHCPYMEDILAAYEAFVAGCDIRMPDVPVYSCLSGELYGSVADIRRNIVYQLTTPVLWRNILDDLRRRGGYVFLEAGPGSALGKFISQEQGKVLSLEKIATHELQTALGEYIKDMTTPVTKCMSLIVSTPDYNDDATVYDERVLPLYRELQELQEQIEAAARLPLAEEVAQAIAILINTCRAKKTPPSLLHSIQQELLQSFPGTATFLTLHPSAPVTSI